MLLLPVVLLLATSVQAVEEPVEEAFEEAHPSVDEEDGGWVDPGTGSRVVWDPSNAVTIVQEWGPTTVTPTSSLLTRASCIARNYHSGGLTVRFIPVEFSDNSAEYLKLPASYRDLILRNTRIMGKTLARVTGKPYEVTPIIEDIQQIEYEKFFGQEANTMSELYDWAMENFECDDLCSLSSTVHGCMVVPASSFVNAAYLGAGFSLANLGSDGETRTFLHELMHANFYSAHDRCNMATYGRTLEYGNGYSSLGRPMADLILADPLPTPGLSTALQHNLLLSSQQLVDVGLDGQQVVLGAFDVPSTRTDPDSVLAARVSLDMDEPFFYLLVSFRALVDAYTKLDSRDAASSPPQGGVVITGHYRVGETGYSAGAGVVDVTPGSVASQFFSGPNDCHDGAMRPGQQFYLSTLDLMIEVDAIETINFRPETRLWGNEDQLEERVEAISQITERSTATVTFYRISGLPARRAATCGNGVRDPSEQCDGGLGCTPECQCAPSYEIILGNERSSDCRPICGNGQRDFYEECDASAGGTSGENCNAETCTCVSGTYPVTVTFDESFPRSNQAKCYTKDFGATHNCGDGERQDTEVCDGVEGCNQNCQCDTRPELLVSGFDTDEDLTEYVGGFTGKKLRSLIKVTGQCVDWFHHSDIAGWASSFRGTYGGLTNYRADGGTTDDAALSPLVIAGIVAGGVACCALCVVALVCGIFVLRRRSKNRLTAAAGLHHSSRDPAHRQRRSRSGSTGPARARKVSRSPVRRT